MKLSDIMSAADLAIYAEIGLVCFLVAFLAVVAKVSLTKSSSYQDVVNIPLCDAAEANSGRATDESAQGKRA